MNTPRLDPRSLTFSQAQGYAELSHPLKLGEISVAARNLLWSVLYYHLDQTKRRASWMAGPGYNPTHVGEPWHDIFRHLHIYFHCLPLDEFTDEIEPILDKYKSAILQAHRPINEVFDLLQEIMRHRQCPVEFIDDVSAALIRGQLAYIVNKAHPVTILPAVTSEEGQTIARALEDLDQAGLVGAEEHLRNASECIVGTDWPGAVRESIHAVESVARQIEPSAKTLGSALAELEKRKSLHPAMKTAFIKLYGYTSDEQGVRHALLDKPEAEVGQDEAVFVLGACAAFASYLYRKHMAL